MSRQLYLNFIKDNRWKYIVNGLGTTLQITFFAVILGIALGFLILVEDIRGMQAIMKKWRTKNNDEF